MYRLRQYVDAFLYLLAEIAINTYAIALAVHGVQRGAMQSGLVSDYTKKVRDYINRPPVLTVPQPVYQKKGINDA